MFICLFTIFTANHFCSFRRTQSRRRLAIIWRWSFSQNEQNVATNRMNSSSDVTTAADAERVATMIQRGGRLSQCTAAALTGGIKTTHRQQ